MYEDKRRTSRMLEVEEKVGVKIDKLLKRLYLIDDMTLNEISDLIDISAPTLCRWLKYFDIPSRQWQHQNFKKGKDEI